MRAWIADYEDTVAALTNLKILGKRQSRSISSVLLSLHDLIS